MNKLFTLCFLAFSASVFGQFDQENVTLLGNYDDDTLEEHAFGDYHEIWGYAADDREYGIITSKFFIHIIDVSCPQDLEEVARIETGQAASWRDVKVYEDHLYVSADNSPEGITIIDISGLPDTAFIVNVLTDQFLSCHNLFIEEATGRMYSAGAGNDGTYVWDLTTDRANPTFLGHANMNNVKLHDIYVRDNIAYASGGYDGYFIYDLTDPTNQVFMASKETQGYNHSSWLSDDGTWAIFAEEVPLGLPMGIMELDDLQNGEIEINNYFQFPLLDVMGTQSTPHNPFIKGDYAYVSYYHDGLMVFDVSDPTNPVRIGYFDALPENTDYANYRGTWGCYPYLPSGNVLISDLSRGLFVLDFTLDESTPIDVECGTASTIDAAKLATKISMFPNPATDKVHIKTGLDLTGPIRIFDQLGRLVLSDEQMSFDEGLDISSLNAGVYSIEFRTEHAAVAKRLIKQ